MKSYSFTKFKISKGRRLLVVVLLIFSFVFGKNFNSVNTTGEVEIKNKYIDTLQGQIDNLNKGVIKLTASDSVYIKKDFIKVNDSQPGRIIFRYSFHHGQSSAIKTNNKPKFTLILTSDSGEEKLLRDFSIESNDNQDIYKEIVFDGDNDFKNLEFRRDDKEDGVISIDNVNLSLTETKNPKPTIFGQADLSSVIGGTETGESSSPVYTFTRRNQTVGEIIKPNSTEMSTIELKLGLRGSGGSGEYNIQLREADLVDSNFSVKSNIVSSFYFSAEELNKYSTADGNYIFPLPAFLKKDHYYFIGIDNSASKFNILNTLQLLGGADDGATGGVVSLNTDGSVEKTNKQIYLKLHGVEFNNFNSEKLLIGSRIEDLGNGNGKYLYESGQSLTDFLNLDKISVPDDQKGKVFYDSVQKGITGTIADGTSFTYKFNTIYPIDIFSIEAETVGDEFYKLEIFYSFDDKEWQKIEEKEDTNKFYKKIQGSDNQHIVYIKVAYDKNDTENIHNLFCLKSLRINSDIKIKQ